MLSTHSTSDSGFGHLAIDRKESAQISHELPELFQIDYFNYPHDENTHLLRSTLREKTTSSDITRSRVVFC
jgi:hypothetical protein